MKNIDEGRNIFVNWLINMLLNFRWSIPGLLVLAAHFIFGFPPLWVFFAVLAIWPLKVLFFTSILRLISWISSTPSPKHGFGGNSRIAHVTGDAPSKNPYSATRRKEEQTRKAYSGTTEGEDYYAKYLSSTNGTDETVAGTDTETPPPDAGNDGVHTDENGVRWVTVYGSDNVSKDE